MPAKKFLGFAVEGACLYSFGRGAGTLNNSTEVTRREPCDHVIRVYTENAFLVGVVADYVATGLTQEEGAVIIATPLHAEAFADRLVTVGIDVRAAIEKSQLLFLDAECTLACFMVDRVPDRSMVLCGHCRRPQPSPGCRFPKIRVFREMVDLLWNDNVAAAVRLEELWNELLADGRLSLLCAYRLDLLDRRTRSVLHQVTLCHSELMPIQDPEQLEHAVDRAFADVFGTGRDATALRHLMVSAWGSLPPMPKAPAALLSLHAHPDSLANQVFERARRYYPGPLDLGPFGSGPA
jgi:MEDS: MEthanogen/methylotroph, DcmR Sensory domain